MIGRDMIHQSIERIEFSNLITQSLSHLYSVLEGSFFAFNIGTSQQLLKATSSLSDLLPFHSRYTDQRRRGVDDERAEEVMY